MLTSILYISGASAAQGRLQPVAQFLQALSSSTRFIVCWLGRWPGLKSSCLCTLWLAYQLPKCVIPWEDFPYTIFFCEDFWYNSPADNPFSSIKRAKVVQVLHGLRRFSTAEHGWHLGVEGQCPDVVAVGVMIITPGEEAFYGCSGRWIVFSCRCCGCFSFESKQQKKKSGAAVWKAVKLYTNEKM